MKKSSFSYIFASTVPWGIDLFMKRRKSLPGRWYIVCDKNDLEAICQQLDYNFRYAFFPHWSFIVPEHIIERIECVCFHMTDLPYGRGGSPLQNLILRGFQQTKLSALKMTKELDAGPIYMKRDLDLSGSAREIYRRATEIALDMMEDIITREPQPVPQQGQPTFFKRRKPAQSVLPHSGTLKQLYDFIRMLDAPGYPHAFVEHGAFRLEFTDAEWRENEIVAKVTIRKKNGSEGEGG